MIDETKPASPWSSSAAAWRHDQTPVTRFLGGTPLNVALRLFLLSLVVGILLMWLDIRPADLVEDAVRFAQHVWSLGFDAVRQMGDYIVGGAMIVVPLWLLTRVLNMREPR
jgi:hypothetical protein